MIVTKAEQLKNVLMGEPLGDGPLFRDGDDWKLRFDSVRIWNNEHGGTSVSFLWRGKVVLEKSLPNWISTADVVMLEGFEAIMKVDVTAA